MCRPVQLTQYLADLTVSKRPGTSNRIEIRIAVFNCLFLWFSFTELTETQHQISVQSKKGRASKLTAMEMLEKFIEKKQP